MCWWRCGGFPAAGVTSPRLTTGRTSWSSGAVTVNGQALEEPYVAELARGDLDVDLPCRVPGGSWFVMGDHRAVSVDSRSTAVGLLTQEQLLGRVVLRVWPPDRLTLLTGGANTGED